MSARVKYFHVDGAGEGMGALQEKLYYYALQYLLATIFTSCAHLTARVCNHNNNYIKLRCNSHTSRSTETTIPEIVRYFFVYGEKKFIIASFETTVKGNNNKLDCWKISRQLSNGIQMKY